jgi:hypothetical protein
MSVVRAAVHLEGVGAPVAVFTFRVLTTPLIQPDQIKSIVGFERAAIVVYFNAFFRYGWTGHGSGSGFSDIAGPALGAFASLDRF